LSERLAAYERLAVEGQHDLLHVRGSTVVGRTTDFLTLGDGSRVYYAEDLLAVVPADSPTARAAERSQKARKTANTWTVIGSVGMAVASAVALGLMLSDLDDPSTGLTTGAWIGLGGVIVGTGVGVFVPMHYNKVAHDEKVSAFATYDRSLRQQLALCVDGTRLVDCVGTGGGPPSLAPGPEQAPSPASADGGQVPEPAPAADGSDNPSPPGAEQP
jgi:hypothetical protein